MPIRAYWRCWGRYHNLSGMTSDYDLTPGEQHVANKFHELYYLKRMGPGNHRIWEQIRWMGYPVLKTPADLWIYQEIMHEVKPDLVIETGTHLSGSALFFAHMMDIIGKGKIVSIDITEQPIRARHPRISYLLGSSVDSGIVETVAKLREASTTCLVVLDSDHSKHHVKQELALYSPFVSVGSYLVVEDSNINGHPIYPTFGPGPYEAITEFLREDPSFEPDKSREKFLVSWNPQGYLRKTR